MQLEFNLFGVVADPLPRPRRRCAKLPPISARERKLVQAAETAALQSIRTAQLQYHIGQRMEIAWRLPAAPLCTIVEATLQSINRHGILLVDVRSIVPRCGGNAGELHIPFRWIARFSEAWD